MPGLIEQLRDAASAANTLRVWSTGPSRASLLGLAADELEKLQGINPKAVPDLLEVLKDALDYLAPEHNNGHKGDWTNAMISRARAAITKAEK